MRTHWKRFNRMSPKDPMSSLVILLLALCELKDYTLYNALIVLQRDLKDADFDELEKRVMECFYEHLENTHMIAPKILMASDISSALGNALAMGVSHHPCPLCTGGLVCHRFRECPFLAHVIRSGHAYKHGKTDSSWNPSHHSSVMHSSPGESSSNPINKQIVKQERGSPYRKEYGRGKGGGRTREYAMAFLPRAALPLSTFRKR